MIRCKRCWLPSVTAFAFVLLATANAETDRLQPKFSGEPVKNVIEARKIKQDGNPARAIEILETTVATAPGYYLAQYQLGLSASEAGRLDKSIDAFMRAMEIREREKISEYTIFNSFGWTYLLAGKLQNAEKLFREGEKHADKLTSDSRGRLFNNMGWMYMQWGQRARARSYFEKADKLNYPDAKRNLAHLKGVE